MVGVYENLSEMESPQLSQYKEDKEGKESKTEDEECEQCISPTTKGLIRQFERMSGKEEENADDEANPQWREYWGNRQ